jgi:hypothetical protein
MAGRLVLGLLAALILGLPGVARADLKCSALKDIMLRDASVSGISTEDVAPERKACRFTVVSHPKRAADLRAEIWVPVGPAWNGRLVQLGSDGLSAEARASAMRNLAARGYAAVGADLASVLRGGEDDPWARLRETTVLAKTFVLSQKGSEVQRTYFMGCSDGGREGLVAAQRFYGEFDGVVVGAPRADAPFGRAVPADLSAFRAKGGKLVHYHGAADDVVPARASIAYYEEVRRRMGDPSGFYRLFLVPGMLHCGDGPGPSNVDWLGAVENWVERGAPPAQLIATNAPQDGGPLPPRRLTQRLTPWGAAEPAPSAPPPAPVKPRRRAGR